jgi:hypothetical protein
VIKLPQLSPTAKAQLWGMCVGGSTALLATYRLGFGLGLFLVGWAAAWVLGERLFGARLVGKADTGAITLGVVSGLAFPWIGFLFAGLFVLLRP